MRGYVKVERDEAFNEKVIYLCQVPGCGLDINEFPISPKDPAPRWCRFHGTPASRRETEQEFNERQAQKVQSGAVPAVPVPADG